MPKLKYKNCKLSCKGCLPKMFRKESVLTIEVSMVLPLFLLVIMTLVSVMTITLINMKMRIALNNEANYIAMKSYDDNDYTEDGVLAEIKSSLGNNVINSGFIKNGENGIEISESDFSNDEIVDVILSYTAVVPFDIMHVLSLNFSERAVVHKWVGYIDGLNGYSKFLSGEIVYVTNGTTVYHRDRNCSHIKLTIRKVNGGEINNIRNESGGKYKRCEICKSKTGDENLYITSDGDRFHNTLSCSGLKRNVKTMLLSKAINEGRRACTRCGY